MSILPPIVGPTDGLLVYKIYCENDTLLYVGSTIRGIKNRLYGHRSEWNLQQWTRQYGPLHVQTIGGFASELEMRMKEEEILQESRPPCNKTLVVREITDMLNHRAPSVA